MMLRQAYVTYQSFDSTTVVGKVCNVKCTATSAVCQKSIAAKNVLTPASFELNRMLIDSIPHLIRSLSSGLLAKSSYE